MINLANIKKNEPYDLYIARANKYLNLKGSKWANPFVLKRESEREEILEKYRNYILESPDLMESLIELRDKTLGCFCYPKSCHGGVLKALYLEYFTSDPLFLYKLSYKKEYLYFYTMGLINRSLSGSVPMQLRSYFSCECDSIKTIAEYGQLDLVTSLDDVEDIHLVPITKREPMPPKYLPNGEILSQFYINETPSNWSYCGESIVEFLSKPEEDRRMLFELWK